MTKTPNPKGEGKSAGETADGALQTLREDGGATGGPPAGRVWIRIPKVMELTGWNRKYIKKLRDNQVLTVWEPYRGAWPWYDREQIERLARKG